MARHLLHVFSTFGVGGPEVRTCDLINHFGDRYRHTIIAMDGNYECRVKLAPNATVELLEVRNFRQEVWRNVRQFSRLLRQLRPDVLLTYNWGAIEWGVANLLTRRGIHLHGEDGFGPEEAGRQKKRRVYARRIFLAGAQHIIVPSRVLARIAREIWKFPPHRVSYIPNGIDIEKYSRTTSHKSDRAEIPGLEHLIGSPLIGTVATLRKEKNIPRLVRVFRQAITQAEVPSNLKLVIVGSGPEQETLRQLIQEQELTEKVIFLGQLPDPSEVTRFFRIFAISSDTEQMPLSVLEAMAAGCPIVGTDVGDMKEMVAPANQAFLCAPSDETAFGRHLVQLLTDEPLRLQIGRDNAVRCREMFDKNLMFENYQKLYDINLSHTNQ